MEALRSRQASVHAPPQTLDQGLDLRSNSIDFLRFALATLVVLLHCFALGPVGPESLARFVSGPGSLAVPGFFALSGFLITRSYLVAPSTGRYLWHRALRIFPAYWGCLLLAASVLAPLVYTLEHGNLRGFCASTGPSALKYAATNFYLKQRQSGIAGLWHEQPVPGYVNGSLWTLEYEFKCYLLVAALGWLGILRHARCVVAGIFFLAWGLSAQNVVVPGAAAKLFPPFADSHLHALVVWFLAGMVYYLYRERIVLDQRLGSAAAALTAGGMIFPPLMVVAPLVAPYVLFWLAAALPLRRFARHGDVSYGLYVYAFPVQQLLSYCGLSRWGCVPYFLLSMVCTLPIAYASYHFLERPALKLKNARWPWGWRYPSSPTKPGTHDHDVSPPLGKAA